MPVEKVTRPLISDRWTNTGGRWASSFPMLVWLLVYAVQKVKDFTCSAGHGFCNPHYPVIRKKNINEKYVGTCICV